MEHLDVFNSKKIPMFMEILRIKYQDQGSGIRDRDLGSGIWDLESGSGIRIWDWELISGSEISIWDQGST